MVVLNLSDATVRLLDISKSGFGKISLSSLSKIDLKKDENWEEKLPTLKGDVAVSIPSSLSHYLRFSIDADLPKENMSALVFEKIQEHLKLPLDKVIYDTAVIGKNTVGHQIAFVGVEYEKLLPFYKSLKNSAISPVLLTPDSFAYFEAVREELVEGQIGVFVNAEDGELFIMSFDRLGPIEIKTEKADEDELAGKINKFVEKTEKIGDVSKIILAGDEGEDIKSNKLKIEVPCIPGRTAVEELLIKKDIKIKDDYVSKTSFINTIGLGLLTLEKNKFNLMKTNLFPILEELSNKSKAEDKPEEKPEEAKTEDKKVESKKEKKEDALEEKSKPSRPMMVVEEEPAIMDHTKEEELENQTFKQSSGGGGFKRFFFLFLLGFTIGLASLGIYLNKEQLPFTTFGLTQAPTVVPTEEPTPVPTEAPITIQKDKLKVQVLNGTGKAGAASTMAEVFSKAGYENVKTGNADNYEYTKNVLKTKSGYTEEVRKDLKDIVFTSETLTDESNFDIVFIVGSQTSE